jgi:hypothetical protein
MHRREYREAKRWLWALLLMMTAPLVPGWAQPPKGETQTLQVGEWYTVTCPKPFFIDTVADITVAYKGIEEKTRLCCDLHYQKADGSYGGFYATDWRPKPEIQGDGQYTFRVSIRALEDISTVTLLVFTAPDGDWAKRSRVATSTPLPVVDADPGYTAWSKQVKYNRSWIAFQWKSLQQLHTEGDRLEITLEYYLDPADHYKKTTLTLEALGPRIPKAGAPQPVSFADTQHVWYGAQRVEVEPGHGTHTFVLTVPKALPQNSLLMLALFNDSRGKRWPWHVRQTVWYQRKGGYFELETAKPGNLFTYDEPVQIRARLKQAAKIGEQKVLRYKVFDAQKSEVAAGEVPFTVEREGQVVPIDVQLTRRGTFLIQAEVEGWEARETTFCRIPDVMKLTGGASTPFGMTVHCAPALEPRTRTIFEIARRLGFTHCRSFTEWNLLEPGPDVYSFDGWDPFFDAAQQAGIDTSLCIYNPPAWAMARGQDVSYRMFDCDLGAFGNMVRTVSDRYRGKFGGWEWLNEIVPGGTADCVGDYVKLCRTGFEAARSVDPKLRSELAGGLWPRNFRLDLLNAGVGKYIDTLAIHYGNGSGIQEARDDLDAYGLGHVSVWDNESAAEMITWGWPGLEVVSETTKSNWVLTQWADELCAGAKRIVYFGGTGNPIGDWDYLLADHSPLPVAATLAVFASKLWDAKPVGLFTSQGKAGVFHVFERQGKPVLVASSNEAGGERVALAVGVPEVTVTDYQGNETRIATRDGVAELALRPLRCFVEGADLDVIRAYLAPAIQVPNAGGKREVIGARPTVSVLVGQPCSVPVRLWNPYDRVLEGTLSLDVPAEWGNPGPTSFSVAPGETQTVKLPVTVPADVQPGAFAHRVTVKYVWAKLPVVDKPLVLSVFDRKSVGNLLTNGDFEQANADGVTPQGWSGTNARLFPASGLGVGLGRNVLRFENASTWAHYGQQVSLQGGMTYLYTAWIWNEGMQGGSNISQIMKDGSRRELYNNQVINMGDSTPGWQVFTCRYKAPADLATASFVPVAMGPGRASFDNLRVTVFEGTDFAAEAWRVSKPPVIDGNLDDWDLKCPIPLIGRNQLQVFQPGYKWTSQNLSGVAYLAWDASNLYVAVQVVDDVHVAAGEGETVTEGDSIILAFDPAPGEAGSGRQASAYYVSSQRPTGGSGTLTLWRSQQHSGGRPPGHLARDSSVYEVAVKPGAGGCVYELRLPLSELGGITGAFASKFGFAIQIHDNDGQGLAAQMTWGGGMSPSWQPASFGRITMVE